MRKYKNIMVCIQIILVFIFCFFLGKGAVQRAICVLLVYIMTQLHVIEETIKTASGIKKEQK